MAHVTGSYMKNGVIVPRSEGPSPSAMDGVWAIAFKINLAVTIVSAVCFGRSGLELLSNPDPFGRNLSLIEAEEDAAYGAENGLSEPGARSAAGEDRISPLSSALFMVGVACLFSQMILMVLIRWANMITQVSYMMVAAMCAMILVLTMAAPHPSMVGAAPAALGLFFSVRFWMKHKSRIRFAAANVKVAALAIKSMPSTVWFSIAMGVVQVLWAGVTCIAATGSKVALDAYFAPEGAGVNCHGTFTRHYTAPNLQIADAPVQNRPEDYGTMSRNTLCGYESGYGPHLMCFWFVSLVWSSVVIQSVVAATINGAVASWWFSPDDPKPVLAAFKRATSSSLGSLCKAAAITTAVRVIRQVAEHAQEHGRRHNAGAARFAGYVLAWIQIAVDYALAYTMCFIGIYGLDFSAAANRACELFKSRGVTTMANDYIVDVALTMTAVIAMYCTILTFHLVVPMEAGVGVYGVSYTLMFIYLAGMMVISTTLEVVRAGFKTVFVCFVQDPGYLLRNHDRKLHEDLSAEWRDRRVSGDSTDSTASWLV